MKKPFTEQEQKVMDLLVEAQVEFSTLPSTHPDEGPDWRNALHVLQGLLMQRVTRRDYPKDFYSLLNK